MAKKYEARLCPHCNQKCLGENERKDGKLIWHCWTCGAEVEVEPPLYRREKRRITKLTEGV